jgi:hypothetical protein
MTDLVRQSRNTVNDGDLVAGNKSVVNNNFAKPTKLSSLFVRLQKEFNEGKEVTEISDNLKRYSEPRDVIGLEQKLIDGDKQYLLEDAVWLKQEYFKKLTKFQFFEPAQEIHAFILGIVLEKFRNIIYPKMRSSDFTDLDISQSISVEIINPIINIIQDQGCNDIMGLGATDIEGMVYFLTGQCHIKWYKNDSLSSGI